MEGALQGAGDDEVYFALQVFADKGGDLGGLHFAQVGEGRVGEGVVQADVVGAVRAGA